jgi:lipopolysaccharide/colanic/teichoic acid biosynthesis glycosyltransferase
MPQQPASNEIQADSNSKGLEGVFGQYQFGRQSHLISASNQPLIRNANRALDSASIPMWKHMIDYLFILMTAAAWLPLMVLIAFVIKLVSRGPIFFRQERIGYRNKPFICLKFRSMKVGANTSVHAQHMNNLIASNVPMTKLDGGDSRLIRFGSFLRSSGLDELPQFINIMRREMSLVGPRPCTKSEYLQYSEWHKERFNTLPGLTGLWQVNGKNKTTFNEMMDLDIRYAREKTVRLDLQIILKTFPAIFGQIRETKQPSTRRCGSKISQGRRPGPLKLSNR